MNEWMQDGWGDGDASSREARGGPLIVGSRQVG